MLDSYDASCNLPKPVCKLLQRQLYDVVSSRTGCLLITVLLLLVSLSTIHLAELFAARPDFVFRDNVSGRDLSANFVSAFLPVDVVYTWVNGSDPRFLDQLHETKHKIQRELTPTSEFESNACHDPSHCFLSNFLVISPPTAGLAVSGLVGLSTIPYPSGQNVTVAEFDTVSTAAEYYLTGFPGREVAQVFYTLNKTEFNIESTQAAFAVSTDGDDFAQAILQSSPEIVSVVKHKSKNLLDEAANIFFINLRPDFSSGEFEQLAASVKSASASKISMSPLRLRQAQEIIPEKDVSKSRYVDNEELRYSLRSLEKFAPWVRKIFLVTNGQIPSWLDLEATRLHVVTHAEIFPDPSHLPTFSSPAIESHLHNIEGLSDNFLYFNDDVLLGQPVWPADFEDQLAGTKLRLAWAIPSCHSSCPNAWINDGYCDRICNTPECDFDGGDCRNQPTNHSDPDSSWRADGGESSSQSLCASGCMNSWLADKFCDMSCNVAACAYDLADCGVEQFDALHEIPLEIAHPPTHQNLRLTPRHTNFYFNFSSASIGEVVWAEMNSTADHVWAGVNTQFNVLSVAIHQNNTHAFKLNFKIDFKSKSTNKSEVVTFDLLVAEKTEKLTSQLPRQNRTSDVKQELRLAGPKEPLIRHQAASLAEPDFEKAIERANGTFPDKVKLLLDSRAAGLLTESGLANALAQLYQNGTRSEYDGTQFMKRKLQAMPWEREPEMKAIGELIARRWRMSHQTRKTLDTFGDSLKYVNKLYNGYFGFKERKVIAHMPHMINRKIMADLQSTFPDEFRKTSSNRIRSTDDMQFAFAYFYYLKEAPLAISDRDIFDEMDTDKSGVLSDRELRLFITKIHDLPIRLEYLTSVEDALKKCAANQTEREPIGNREEYFDKKLPQVTKKLFINCGAILDKVEKLKTQRKRFKTVELDDGDIEFQMIGSNVSTVIGQLDNVRKNQKKFLCINDDMDHGGKDAAVIRALLHDMYETLFPFPSQFELPPHFRNRFATMDEFAEWKRQKRRLLYLAQFFIVLLLLTLFSPKALAQKFRRIARRF